MATPVYLISGLVGLGWYLNKDGRKERVKISRKRVSKHHVPNQGEIYNSNNVKKARAIEQRMADENWELSKDPINTNIIPISFNQRHTEIPVGKRRSSKKIPKPALTKATKSKGAPVSKEIQKLLLKERDIVPLAKVSDVQGWKKLVSKEDKYTQKRPGFFHNNMEPFFGGSIKQNMRDDIHRTKLEHFTGTEPAYRHKKEVKRMFKPVKQNIHGQPVSKDRQLNRFHVSDKKPNQLPFAQVKVQPGVETKIGDKAKHGFHDDFRPKYKTVDELRLKPKISYKGRIVKGLKHAKRGKRPNVVKRNPERFGVNEHGDLVKQTFGGMSKSKKRERFALKSTARASTSKEYAGNAKAAVSAQPKAGLQRVSKKPSYKYPTTHAKGSNRSYNKGKVRTPAKAQFCIPVGNAKPQENETYTYNPNDIARTTIKETTIANNVTGGVGGQINKPTTYDPKNAPRPTQREGLHGKNITGITGGQIEKLTVYDPNDLARNTVKETLVGKNVTGGIGGQVNKLTTYDPNDIARRTGKETLADKNRTGLISAGQLKHIAHDPEDRLRETIREQTENSQRQSGNVQGKGRNVNPYSDKAKATIRQQTGTTKRGEGGVSGNNRRTNPYTDDARKTIRQQTQNAKRNKGGVSGSSRNVNPYTDKAKATIRQQTAKAKRSEGGVSGNNQQTSRVNMYNAEINAMKECTLKGRKPTLSGPKNALGSVAINMETRSTPLNPKWVIKRSTSKGCRNVPLQTAIKNQYCPSNRNSPDLLTAFKKNPYTQDLTSAPSLNV